MRHNKSILFIIWALGNGGSEKMLLNLMNCTKLIGYKKILYLYNNIIFNSYENLIEVPHIKYVSHDNKKFKFITILNRLFTLAKIVKREKVKIIFSFASQGALLAVVIKLLHPFRKIKVIVRLGTVFNNLFYSPNGNILKRRAWEKITLFFTYKYVNKIVCMTHYMRNVLISKSKNLQNKIAVIRNYIDKEKVEELAKEKIEIPYKFFISVGRLEREKNYEGIVEAFNSIKHKTRLNYIILGEGRLRSDILNKISDYSLQERIFLLGFKENPYKYISKAEGLLLYSDFEGMPNVVIEALICKTPVIVSDFPGVEDIITNKINGIVVKRDNIEELAASMKKLIDDDKYREGLVTNGYESALHFTTSIREYEHLMNKI